MNAKYVILTGIILAITLSAHAQVPESLYEPYSYSSDSVSLEIRERMRATMQKFRDRQNNRKISEVFTFSGKITDWHYNEDFIYDGFYLQTQDTTYLVRFEKAMGERILNIGNDVILRATIIKEDSSGNIKFLNLVNIQGKGDILYSNGAYNYHFLSSKSEYFRKGQGKIVEFLYYRDDKEKSRGFILDDNTTLVLDDFAMKQLSEMITIGKTIEYTGIISKTKEGEVKAKESNVIHCQTITIDKRQFLVISSGCW
jgi:hypothetical protein